MGPYLPGEQGGSRSGTTATGAFLAIVVTLHAVSVLQLTRLADWRVRTVVVAVKARTGETTTAKRGSRFVSFMLLILE
jgi:hypothetical protein